MGHLGDRKCADSGRFIRKLGWFTFWLLGVS